MLIPKISIEKMLPGIYGWQVFSEAGVLKEEYGDDSIEQCLQKAVCGVPSTVSMIEILFCGFHMGMISTSDIRKAPHVTANQIMSLHGARSHNC